MLSKKMEDALIEHINKEMHSGYLYMSMSAHSTSIGLKGFATWFMVQYHEEMFHAMKIYEYIASRGGKVILAEIESPPESYESPLNMFEKTLAHEQLMTSNINQLMELSIAEKDHATQIFLQWFVSEQVEEEENDNDIIARLKLIGNDSNGLFMVDKELGSRTVVVATDFSKGVTAAA
ncbi:MAG: ferritin [Proteobacteria bacterium]|nr:ferritin [Pseudomonadota bacterium]